MDSHIVKGAHQLNNELFKIILLAHQLKTQLPSNPTYENTLSNLDDAVKAAMKSGEQLVSIATCTTTIATAASSAC